MSTRLLALARVSTNLQLFFLTYKITALAPWEMYWSINFLNTLSYERASKVEKYILNMFNVFGLQSKLIRVGIKKDQLIWHILRNNFIQENT